MHLSVKMYDILKININDLPKPSFDLQMSSKTEFRHLIRQQNTPLFEQIKKLRGYETKKIEELIFLEAKHNKKKISYLKTVLKDGFMYNGRHYKRFGKSASQAKDGVTVFIASDYYDEVMESSQLGIEVDKCVVSKYESYRCLILSACQMVDGKIPNIVMVDEFTKVIPDQYVRYAIEKDVDIVDKKTNQKKAYKNRVIEEGYQDIEISPFDGFGVHTEEMSKLWSGFLGLDCTPIAYQVRLPFLKGVSIQAPFKDILKNHCKVDEIVDVFGKSHKIEDIDCIWNVSLWKGYGIFKNKFGSDAWTEYLKRIDDYEYNLGISKYNHHTKDIDFYRGSNFQYLQCLDLINPKYVKHFTSEDKSKRFDFLDVGNWGKIINIAKYSTDLYEKIIGGDKLYTLKYLGLVNGGIGEINKKYIKAIMINDVMLKDICVKRTLHRMLNKTINEMKFGKILTSGFYHLVVGDIIGYLEYCAKKDVVGCLKEREFYCETMPLGECLSMRSPLVDPSEVNKINIVDNDITKTYFKYFKNHDVCMVNLHDISMPQQGGMDLDGDLVNLCNDEIMLNSVIDKPIIVDMTDKISAKPVEYNMENIIAYECNTRDNRIGEITNIATSILNQVTNNEKWQKINADNISLLRLYQGKEIDFIKTSYRWVITKNLRRYLKKLPYFLLFNYPKKLNVYNKIQNINKTVKEKENKAPYNAYISPSPLNELCMYINEWEKKCIVWNNNAVNTREYLINHDYPADNKYIKMEIRKLCNDFTSQFYSLIKKNDLEKERDDLDIRIDLLFDEYREKLDKINIDIKLLTNYCVDICYSSKNRDKVFCWAMVGDTMLKNLKNNSIGAKKAKIIESTKNDKDAKEYMGKYYKLIEVEN